MAEIKTLGLFVLLLGLFCLSYSQSNEPCQTPKEMQGECKLITDCPPLFKILKDRPINSQNADYLRRSQCGFDEASKPRVCCPVEESVSPRILTESITMNVPVTSVSSNLLPNVCGDAIQDKIYGGDKAGLSEFPWMALLQYEWENGARSFNCGGALISQRYVLTAAHCVITFKPKVVRLGEYDIKSEIDCENNGFKDVCAPAPVDVPIEEILPYEEYNRRERNRHHDIALLRLANEVEFSKYIKPTCLPLSANKQTKDLTGKRLTVAGWGQTENSVQSNVKLKVEVPVKANAGCVGIYKHVHRDINSGQICAGGESGKDSCVGDSGGPLMNYDVDDNGDLSWFTVGIVSYGPSPCGEENWPGVYTKVASYVAWIVSKLKP